MPYACLSRTATAHREGVCVCSPHTRPAPTLCTPRGECTPFASSHCRGRAARRPARRIPLCQARQVCRTLSARRPAPPSIRTCVWLLARLRTHFLVVTGSSGTLPPKVGLKQQTLQFKRNSVRPRLCAHLALVYRRCRQCASAAVPLCTVSRRAPIRGNPIACAALARRRVARRPKISSLAHRPAQRRSPRPTAPCSNPRAMPRG
jgi:hypothetical protein